MVTLSNAMLESLMDDYREDAKLLTQLTGLDTRHWFADRKGTTLVLQT